MKERPIIFSTPMVQAILSGDKTQTRRVVKLKSINKSRTNGYDWEFRDKRMLWHDVSHEKMMNLCPYGKPGDRLWVRETFYRFGDMIFYKASIPKDQKVECSWKPSIHMPRAASRILLEITDIRVERLQDISEEDAKEEGVSMCYETSEGSFVMPDKKTDFILGPTGSYYSGFKSIWHSINGSESWSENPFVWAVEFRRINP